MLTPKLRQEQIEFATFGLSYETCALPTASLPLQIALRVCKCLVWMWLLFPRIFAFVFSAIGFSLRIESDIWHWFPRHLWSSGYDVSLTR